jgi:hypothetical protein
MKRSRFAIAVLVVTMALVVLQSTMAFAWNDGTEPGSIPWWCTTLEEIAKYKLFGMW